MAQVAHTWYTLVRWCTLVQIGTHWYTLVHFAHIGTHWYTLVHLVHIGTHWYTWYTPQGLPGRYAVRSIRPVRPPLVVPLNWRGVYFKIGVGIFHEGGCTATFVRAQIPDNCQPIVNFSINWKQMFTLIWSTAHSGQNSCLVPEILGPTCTHTGFSLIFDLH